MNEATLKKNLDKWEEFRKSITQSTPVPQDETHDAKTRRIKHLEDHPQEWKEYYFPKYFTSASPNFHLEASDRLLTNFANNKHWYETRWWARGLSKSTTLMFDVLYLVLTGKLKSIILTSSTYDAAERFLTKYQCELDSNQRLIYDYGKQERVGSWSMGGFTTINGVKFLALGAGQSPRGESNEEYRTDCIIVDDFDTDEECRNEEIIDKKWAWFERALFFTVDVSKPYLIVWLGNIIAEDCCVVRAGKLSDYCETINIRDEYGVSVWPEKNSEQDIDYQLEHVSYESGEQELFNNPIRPGQAFKEMKWGKCPPLSELSFVVIYADPSPSNKDQPSIKAKATKSCKAVFIIGGKGLNRYVYYGFLDTTSNSIFIDWLFAANDYCKENKAKIALTYIENNTLQNPFYEQVLTPLIASKSKTRGGGMLPVKPDGRDKPDKYVRIEGNLEPLNRQGQLILNIDEKDNPHMKRLESQFKAVRPGSKTMDGPDCVEGGVFIINNRNTTTAATVSVQNPYTKKQKRYR